MAPHLVAGGHQVTVFDTSADAVGKLVSAGAKSAATPREVAAASDVVITMLPNTNIVKQVYYGEDGVFAGCNPGSLFIDCSTIDPHTPKELLASAEEKNGDYVDAPVSGGVMAAQNAGLTFLVGGTTPRFERAKEFLDAMGANVLHCGEMAGAGETVKLCNNLILAISMTGVSEAMLLGTRLGCDAKQLAAAINVSTGRCWSSDTYNPFPGVLEGAPSTRGYTGGFFSALMLKDLGLALDAADTADLATPLGTRVHALYKEACQTELGGMDFSSILKHIDGQKKA